MQHWMMWLTGFGVLVTLEIFTGTFYLLMIALGALAGAAMAFVGLSAAMQLIVAALVGVTATIVLNRSRLGRPSRVVAARDRNVNLDIGQTVTVTAWHLQIGGAPTARVQYRGAQWDVEYAGSGAPAAGLHTITEMRGSQLLVVPHIN